MSAHARVLGSGLTALILMLAGSASAATTYPLQINNCGFSVRVEKAPERVVTIKSTATEMLLALGLGAKIVGTGFSDGPLPEPWAAAGAKIPVLADKVPSAEVVLETSPDLVYAGWESNFSGEGAGERQMLADLGVASYVSPAACKSAPYRPEKLSFEQLFEQIGEVGAIFGVSGQADALVAEQRAMLDSIKPSTAGLTAVWYSSGTATPYLGAGSGGPQMTLEALGLGNIMVDVKDSWASGSWEAVVDADPDVFVLVDAAWNSAAQKRKLLAENPATRNLDAVRNERYLVIPFPAAEPGVRSVPAALDLARQLEGLQFAP